MRERIRQVMDSMGLSQQEFAQKLGMSPASLSNIFNGRSNPTNNHVQAIHRAFPNINTNWLMFGEGTMLNDDAKKSSDSAMPDSASGSLTQIQICRGAITEVLKTKLEDSDCLTEFPIPLSEIQIRKNKLPLRL